MLHESKALNMGIVGLKPRQDTFLVWIDSWKISDSFVTLKDKFPRLFSYALNDQMFVA
jgi:hypothetical protein